MQSTKELFDIDPTIFKQMSYPNVLLLKRKQSILLLKKELKIHYLKRDYHRINKLSKAIKNMDRLLIEIDVNNKKENTFTKFIKYIKQKIRKN